MINQPVICVCFQLFVRVYGSDNSSKSILVDEEMTVGQVVDILVAKNHVHPHLNWGVVEHMTDLHMGTSQLVSFWRLLWVMVCVGVCCGCVHMCLCVCVCEGVCLRVCVCMGDGVRG